MVKSMNYSFQALEQERLDAFEAAITELTHVQLQGGRQEASVAAAVNEELSGGGRTAGLIKRSTSADTNRAVSAIKDNYSRKSNEIDLNKEATLLSTQTQIAGIPRVGAPSPLSTLFTVGTSYLQARQTGESVDAIRRSAGVIGGGNSAPNTSSYQYSPTYTGLLGDIDFNNKFKFEYTNPYTQKNQSVNYF